MASRPPIFTNNRRHQHYTVLALILSETPRPRQINALYRHQRKNTRKKYGSLSKSGKKYRFSDKYVEKRTGRRRCCLLNAYPLCSGNDETRDHRCRRISVEISADKRTCKRPTASNIQPKLTGYFGR